LAINRRPPRQSYILYRLAGTAFLLALLLSSLLWVAQAQEGGGQPASLPPVKGTARAEDLPGGSETPPPITVPLQLSNDPALRRKIEPALLKQLIDKGGRAPIIAEVSGAANLVAASAETDPARRRRAVVAGLQTAAQQSQAGALATLAEREAAGGAANVRSFWIFNGLAADADLDTVLALAARPEVRFVRQERTIHLAADPTSQTSQPAGALAPQSQGTGWNITQIRADLVWNALQVDGSGVVVANIDTGVDLLHPALLTRYRGYDSHGLYQHACNWFDATEGGATYPVDANGHGTHTMGTMLGGGGIGVAPGAKWVAVRAFDNQGIALESWLHTAMEWIVNPGPGCDPANAPDVVNNSWSASWGGVDVFRGDVQALRAAGVFAAFAAGNSGPYEGSIGAPGSYPESFSVGAVTSGDVVADFSGRGPSDWYGSSLVKPEVSAPGVNVRSSLPGGAYGELSGTSMATPHVAGLAALMLQADPGLTVSQLETVIKETAVRLGSPIPNNDYGWGRIDAYAAVAAVAHAGTVRGTVTRAADGAPIAGAALSVTPSLPGSTVTTFTGADGSYTMALAPDRYTLTASAFGYAPAVRPIVVTVGVTTTESFTLSALPTGILTGQVTSGGLPITPAATIAVEDTPVTATTDASGVYTAVLPAGNYTLTVSSRGHRVAVAAAVPIIAGEATVRNFDLITAPTILLVDSGAWYSDSKIDYYRHALDDLLYTYDVWTVNDPISDAPAAGNLLPYDIVFWSSPQDSPGYLNASDALTTYLKSGGSLFLSGQNVAFYDDFYPFIYAPYFRWYLKTAYVRDDAGTFNLAGAAGGLFDGLTFSIHGPGGADNQETPDEVQAADPDFATSAVNYAGDGSGGQQVGHCLPYRAIHLAFGFEAITDTVARTEIISRSISWFISPLSSAGVELTPTNTSLIGNFGQTVTHTLRIRNTAETGDAETFNLTPDGFAWPTTLLTPSVSLSPCASALVTLTVQVPVAAAWAATDSVTLTAQSAAWPGLSAAARRETRAPAPLLLVDDDRWYNVESHYENALAANGIPYDVWKVPWSFSGNVPPSPPLDTLRMYPMVVWFSAYDWLQPLTPTEEDRLAAYLDGGGRLYYNGQDYLFYRGTVSDFARTYLGVADHTEDFISTRVVGVVGNPVGSYLGPANVAYPYKNYSDALSPTASAKVAFVGQADQPNALTNAGDNSQGGAPWRTTFFAFDPDGLDDATNARLMQRVAGWLSWLGSSTVSADRPLARDGDTLTYTVVLRNDGWQDMSSAYLTATFNADLEPITDSGVGVSWDPGQSAFVWTGALAQGQSLTFTYRAAVVGPLPAGYVLSHTVWMGYDSHFIQFDRIATTDINAPLLSQSAFSVTPPVGERGGLLTYTLEISNTGVAGDVVTATNSLPGSLALVSGSLKASGGTPQTDGRVITWTGPVAVGEVATLSYTAVISQVPPGFVLRNRAVLDDGLGHMLPLDAWARVEGMGIFLPVILK
jgi:uncharacterized repeat protein (TIGR01451 family)